MRWLVRNGPKLGLDPEGWDTRQRVLAAAERAVEVGDKPGGLFLALLRDGAKGDWSKLSDQQIDRGKRRLMGLERESESGPVMLGAALANGGRA